MAFTRGQFRNFTRELEFGTRGLTGPAASRRLAAMARAHIAEVERQQAARSGGVVPDHTTTVDGRAGAAPEQVRPDGVILIAWHYLTEAVIRTVTYLEENGPERKGGWKASITTFVDDTAVPRTARLPAGATEAVVVVRADYARRLEVGKRDSGGPFVLQVPMHFVEQAAVALRPVLRPLGWEPRFTYVDVPDAFALSVEATRRRRFGQRGIVTERAQRRVPGGRDVESQVRYPAIVLRPIRAARS